MVFLLHLSLSSLFVCEVFHLLLLLFLSALFLVCPSVAVIAHQTNFYLPSFILTYPHSLSNAFLSLSLCFLLFIFLCFWDSMCVCVSCGSLLELTRPPAVPCHATLMLCQCVCVCFCVLLCPLDYAKHHKCVCVGVDEGEFSVC